MRPLFFIAKAAALAPVIANPFPQGLSDTSNVGLANIDDLGDRTSILGNLDRNFVILDPSGIALDDMFVTIGPLTQEDSLGATTLSTFSDHPHDSPRADSSANFIDGSLAIVSDHLPDSVDAQIARCTKSQSNTKRSTDVDLFSSYDSNPPSRLDAQLLVEAPATGVSCPNPTNGQEDSDDDPTDGKPGVADINKPGRPKCKNGWFNEKRYSYCCMSTKVPDRKENCVEWFQGCPVSKSYCCSPVDIVTRVAHGCNRFIPSIPD